MALSSSSSIIVASSILMLMSYSSSIAQEATAPSLSPSPAPSPAPPLVDLGNLLAVAGPFHTFLNYLTQTKVLQTFQDQANNTQQGGITVFAPADSAFSSLKKPSPLSNLTSDQLKSLLLFHALPKYYSLSDFQASREANPVITFAGSSYALNLTDSSGLIRVHSGWTNPEISSSVYSTYPVAVYQLDRVLLPEAIFGPAPLSLLAPAPAPADVALASDLAPSAGVSSPTSFQQSSSESSCWKVNIGDAAYYYCMALLVSAALMLSL